MQNRRNFYRILHVQPDAPAEMIRASHRTLMLRLRQHPDLGGDHWNAALINEAFATLNDPDRRAAYDKTLAELASQRRAGAQPTPAAPVAPAPPSPSAQPATPATPAVPKASSAIPTTMCAFCHTVHAAIDSKRPGALCATCGSPLYAAVRLQPDGTARRALERLPRRMPVDVHVMWPQAVPFHGTCEDVSIGGMLLTIDTSFEPGERLRIECDFCIAVGVVRHRRKETGTPRPLWRIGVEFITLRLPRRRGSLLSIDA